MSIDVRNIAIAKKCLNGGGGSGITINYIGEFESGRYDSLRKTIVDFKTGQYARSDYAELTADNFLILPKTKSQTAEGYSITLNNFGTATKTLARTWDHDQWEYDQSSGKLTFYGGLYSAALYNDNVKTSDILKLKYKIYIIKPGLSQAIS